MSDQRDYLSLTRRVEEIGRRWGEISRKQTKVAVLVPKGAKRETLEFEGATGFHLVGQGVLVVERHNQNIKAFAVGRWLDAEVVEVDPGEIVIDAKDCDHEWTDARNEYVSSGEMCVLCNSIRVGNVK